MLNSDTAKRILLLMGLSDETYLLSMLSRAFPDEDVSDGVGTLLESANLDDKDDAILEVEADDV